MSTLNSEWGFLTTPVVRQGVWEASSGEQFMADMMESPEISSPSISQSEAEKAGDGQWETQLRWPDIRLKKARTGAFQPTLMSCKRWLGVRIRSDLYQLFSPHQPSYSGQGMPYFSRTIRWQMYIAVGGTLLFNNAFIISSNNNMKSSYIHNFYSLIKVKLDSSQFRGYLLFMRKRGNKDHAGIMRMASYWKVLK